MTDIEKVVLTSRQVNTIPERPLTLHNLVILCDVSEIGTVSTAVQRCYSNITVAYSYKTNTSSSIGNKLI